MKWQEFRSLHKGIDSKEISSRWKLYKEGNYDPSSANEQPREQEEMNQVRILQNNSGQQSAGLKDAKYWS
jgi:hypothetical protein